MKCKLKKSQVSGGSGLSLDALPVTRRFTAMDDDPITVARSLLGQRLVRVIDGKRLAGTIVEVEAYLGAIDPAAHTYGGRRTPRNESMYLAGGHAYVYFTYGAHFCMNVVAGEKDEGVAVLIRALEPTEGLQAMYEHRRPKRLKSDVGDLKSEARLTSLCSGPGKLTQALGIDRDLDGVDLRTSSELFVEATAITERQPLPDSAVASSIRIGLNPKESWPAGWIDRALRYYIIGNPHVSR